MRLVALKLSEGNTKRDHVRCAGTILCRQCTSETKSAPSGVIIILSAWFQQLMHRQKHNTENRVDGILVYCLKK